MTNSAAGYAIDNGVAIITLNQPPLNMIGQPMRAAILAQVHRAKADAAVRAVVITGAGRIFCAGADIGEFTSNEIAAPDPNDMYAEIEALGKPVVAAINGAALGGGLELAMSCHYRVAVPAAKFALPEVLLGILPGGGGTQRLPRLVGVEAALEMMIFGTTISAVQAKATGLVNELSDSDLLAGSVACALALAAAEQPIQPCSLRNVDTATLPSNYFEAARTTAGVKSRGAPAPAAIVDCLEAAVQLQDFNQGIAFERKTFFSLLQTPESQALRHLFFAERAASRIPAITKVPDLRSIRKVGIIGGGTMGVGIAINFISAGIPVILLEINDAALAVGVAGVRKNYEASAAKGKISADKVVEYMARLQGTLAYADLADCDLILEAVFENLGLKKQICAQIGQVVKPGAIIATNTSTLDVDKLALASGRVADFVSMHFFSPANVMRLLEVVRGKETAPDVLATVMVLSKTINKVAVVAGVCYGFIGNRMLEGYLRETDALLLEGATPMQIDRALEAFGMAMGPCRMMDMAGVDVNAKVLQEWAKVGGLAQSEGYRAVCQALHARGRNGQKSGTGYYIYEGRNALPDAAVTTLCAELAVRHGIPRRSTISDTEILERCLYPLINEGARILEEGIAYRAGDIDVVWTAGYGFPRVRGGPMHYASQVGLAHIRERMLDYAKRTRADEAYWVPAQLLSQCAAEGRGFD